MKRRTTNTLCAIALVAGCGSRTGLFVSGLDETAETDGGVDASFDARLDTTGDAPLDTLPQIDSGRPDALNPCPDAGATLVYVITEQNELFSFYPPTATFARIGPIACPTQSLPFSMAVDRQGIAYSVFLSGELFRISTANAACRATGFSTGQHGWTDFGMGYAADNSDAGESLFVGESTYDGGFRSSSGLGKIDTQALRLDLIGPFSPAIQGPELTGTGDGRLFAFYTGPAATGSHVAEIEKTTGHVLGQDALTVGTTQDAFAFA